MPLNVSAQIVWAGDIPDEPGGLAEKLGALAKSGANLEFVIARRRPEEPGKGVVFVSPVTGKAAQDAASSSGLRQAMDVPTLRVEGPDQPGLGERMLKAISGQGINLRGFSAASIDKKFVAYIGFYRPEDASRAAQALRALDTGKSPKASKGPAPKTTSPPKAKTKAKTTKRR
jgi:hypothetical protein